MLYVYVLINACVLNEGSERPRKEEASDEDEDTEYFDAMEDAPAFITVTATESTQHRSVSHRGSCASHCVAFIDSFHKWKRQLIDGKIEGKCY